MQEVPNYYSGLYMNVCSRVAWHLRSAQINPISSYLIFMHLRYVHRQLEWLQSKQLTACKLFYVCFDAKRPFATANPCYNLKLQVLLVLAITSGHGTALLTLRLCVATYVYTNPVSKLDTGTLWPVDGPGRGTIVPYCYTVVLFTRAVVALAQLSTTYCG